MSKKIYHPRLPRLGFSDSGLILSKKERKCAVLDKFGVFPAAFGAVWDNFGVVRDKLGNAFTSKNSVFNTKNKEKQTIHTNSSRYNVPSGRDNYLGNIDGAVNWY